MKRSLVACDVHVTTRYVSDIQVDVRVDVVM